MHRKKSEEPTACYGNSDLLLLLAKKFKGSSEENERNVSSRVLPWQQSFKKKHNAFAPITPQGTSLHLLALKMIIYDVGRK